jgi:threonyl-tRNA synthetase
MLLFGSEVRSYRDLPLRIHEQSVLHRMEASGVLSGLTRVREFIMDDAHIFLREDQIGEEVERLLRLVQRVYDDFGLTPEMTLRAQERARSRGPEVHDFRGRRRVLRSEDRLRGHRRARAEVAVRHDSTRLPAAAAVRAEIHRR